MQGTESQLAAWKGKAAKLGVEFQWVQVPKSAEKHFLFIHGAQNTDTANFSVVAFKRTQRVKISLSFAFKHMLKSHYFNLCIFRPQLEGQRVRAFSSASIKWG